MVGEDLGVDDHSQIPDELGVDGEGYIHRIELKMLFQAADHAV